MGHKLDTELVPVKFSSGTSAGAASPALAQEQLLPSPAFPGEISHPIKKHKMRSVPNQGRAEQSLGQAGNPSSCRGNSTEVTPGLPVTPGGAAGITQWETRGGRSRTEENFSRNTSGLVSGLLRQTWRESSSNSSSFVATLNPKIFFLQCIVYS